MKKDKTIKLFLIIFTAAIFICAVGTIAEAGSPLGTFCWKMTYPSGVDDTIELAINDDAPPTVRHLSAVGIWQRVQYNACVPVHGTAQFDRKTREFYELALSYEDIVHVPPIQGHFHAVLGVSSLGGPFCYQDEIMPGGPPFCGGMNPIPCPIQCP